MAKAPIILYALDDAGVFTFAEGRGLATLGLAPEQAVGVAVSDAYRDAPEVLDATRRALAGEALTFTSRTGGRVWDNQVVPLRAEDGGVTGVIGVALAPTHAGDATTALRCADVAMYVAKRAGLGHAVYDPAHDGHDADRLTLAGDLRQALDRDELLLHYQPKVALSGGRAGRRTRRSDGGRRGAGALVRWRHPRLGLIPPDRFIPLAEQTGLIAPLTTWVLEAALRQAHTWARDGLELGGAVNLSMRNLHDPTLSRTVADLLARYDVLPDQVCLELTESAVMAGVEGSQAVLERLSALGVRLAVDDFGTGYSSLAYLARLPVNGLKIDRSFVRRLTRDEGDATIVNSDPAAAVESAEEILAQARADELAATELIVDARAIEDAAGDEDADGDTLPEPVRMRTGILYPNRS